MTGVFISYRKADASPYARQLGSLLAERIGGERVFVDHGIQGGERWPKRIQAELEKASALLALIGPSWRGPDGTRIHDEGDGVRRVIETGLERGIPIVPVLVGGARLPAGDELPESLRDLLDYQALELSDARWDYDVERVLDAVGAPVDAAVPSATSPGGLIPLDPARLLEELTSAERLALKVGGANPPAPRLRDGEEVFGVIVARDATPAGQMANKIRMGLLCVTRFQLLFATTSRVVLSNSTPLISIERVEYKRRPLVRDALIVHTKPVRRQFAPVNGDRATAFVEILERLRRRA